MELVYDGKTKSVHKLADGNYLLKFKDDVTGDNGVFDPGANTVGLSIEGMGRNGIRMTELFYQKIEAAGIPTHFISADIERAELTVKPAQVFGKGLEVICRKRAVGSFLRRFGDYAADAQPLDYLVEMTLKDDDRGDPVITKDILSALSILTEEEYEILKSLTKQISKIVSDTLDAAGCELYDIKLEFGYSDGKIILIDEISAGNMRVYKDGSIVGPLELAKILLKNT